MTYQRVVPRDLFNEADLLKMLGKLVIHIIDRKDHLPWSYEEDNAAFNIAQDPNDGSISCTNLKFYLNGEQVFLKRPLNTRQPWQLLAVFRDEEYYVFSSKGEVMPNFGFPNGRNK
jgi:hypothetical protein